MNKRNAFLVLALITAAQINLVHAADTIPYPAALDSATVFENDIGNVSSQGLLVGNGELNAIIYSSGDDIHLRIGKNDFWDLRVDTKKDPPLSTVDAATGKVTGGHGPAGSWDAPYPTSLPCTELILKAKSPGGITQASLDIGKAVATMKTTTDSTDVRVLAQSDVILIHTDRATSFSGILDFFRQGDMDKWVNKADQGTEAGYSYIHQSIPGDEDMNGMDVYVVLGKKDNLLAVAVVTSRDSSDPLAEAVKLVKNTLADADAVPKHEALWQSFWSKSGVQLGDAELQNWWYRMVYFYRVFSRSRGNPIGLAACFDHLAGWHNSLKLNYNIQQTYVAAGPINHPELLEPFIDDLNRDLPRGEWFAQTSFPGTEGAFFFSDHYPFEPDPAKCTTPWKHQQTYMPWGYTWGMAGHTAVVLWDYYKFAPSEEHLDRVYPLIKQFGLFYCSLLEKCALVDGKRKMGPSFFPECGGYHEYNVVYDINFITSALQIAQEAATLKHDTALLARINAVIGQIPSYGTTPDPEQGGQTIIERWTGSKLDEGGVDRHGTLVQGIFPASLINWFSPDDQKEMAKRTIKYVEEYTTHANSNVTINIARARLGLGDEAIANAKMCFSGKTGQFSQEQPNGLFYWNGHGFYITEQVAISRLVSELLLQSVTDVIRIFPAWPTGTDAHFTNLLAQGGFEVSADQVSGTIANVTIHSTVGGRVKVVSPWAGGFTVTEQSGNTVVPVSKTANISSFPTTAGRVYLLKAAN